MLKNNGRLLHAATDKKRATAKTATDAKIRMTSSLDIGKEKGGFLN